MTSSYPTGLDAFTTGTLTGVVSGSDHGNKGDAINKIEAELGLSPSASQASVVARLDSLLFNVKDYGAVGNGSTDDVTAISAAVTAIGAAGGGTLFFPVGTYITSTYLGTADLPNNILIKGCGMGASIIKIKSSSTLAGGVLQWTDGQNVTIEDISIDLNKAGTSSGGTDTAQMGVYFHAGSATGTVNCHVNRVEVKDGHYFGIRASADTTSRPNEVTISDCKVTGCVRSGIYAACTNGLVVRNNRLSGNCVTDAGGSQIQVTLGTGAGDILGLDGWLVVQKAVQSATVVVLNAVFGLRVLHV